MLGRSIRFTLVFLVLTGLLYPLATTGLGQVLFPHRANGSPVRAPDGTVIGSELIGQGFAQPGFFHGRPSTTRYDASNSGSSNLGPNEAELLKRVQEDVATWQQENPGQPVPADLVTTSGSSLDPHISPEAALAQVPRVGRSTGIPVDRLQALVHAHTEGRSLGIFGEPRVNVLALNVALQQLKTR